MDPRLAHGVFVPRARVGGWAQKAEGRGRGVRGHIAHAAVPTRLHVLYVAGVSFGWNVLLSVSYNARAFNASFAAPKAADEAPAADRG